MMCIRLRRNLGRRWKRRPGVWRFNCAIRMGIGFALVRRRDRSDGKSSTKEFCDERTTFATGSASDSGGGGERGRVERCVVCRGPQEADSNWAGALFGAE